MPSIDDGQRALESANVALSQYDAEHAVAHLSTAVREFTSAGDTRRAAMACVQLGEALANGLGNLTASRAWFAHARRLIADEPPCIEQGWVAVAAMGCDVDDPTALWAAAELALDRARRFGDVNLETKALADAGLALVQMGRIADGMAMLDEAMALACGPADDSGTSAKSACSFFTACYYAADFERASSWADLLRKRGLIGLEPGGPVALSSHCSSVQAKLLIELGRWSEAETILVRAKSEFESAMSIPSWHPDIGLADLRIRQGRIADAESLLIGKDQALEALLPAARLHLARGDHDLARATARRGLRAIGDDQLRSVSLLTVLVDTELATGDVDAARAACEQLTEMTSGLAVTSLRARAAAASARVLAAAGDLGAAILVLEATTDDLDPRRLPYLRVTLLAQLACLRERFGDVAAAALDARAAATELGDLDVVLRADELEVIQRLASIGHKRPPLRTASLARQGKWWVASCDGTRASLPDTKGLRYLAELVECVGSERHVFDLVDRVEGVSVAGGVDRRALGNAGEAMDAQARIAYRHRIEELRAEANDALESGQLEAAEAAQDELDQLVRQLARAFGLGGRARPMASAAEKARLNVTHALRAALTKLGDALPEGAVLDRRVRTGLYCAYEPVDGEVRWIVQSGLNEDAAN